MLVIFLLMVTMVPLLVWVERRGSAFIQNRLGPNRVGPLGLLQLLADAVKFFFKEEFVPKNGYKTIFYLAPIVALIPGAIAFGAIPLGIPLDIGAFNAFGQTWGPYNLGFQSFELGIGVVFVLAVASLGGYSLLLAGWGSGNKYSMMGALRACAQMISYELALGLSLVGILLIYGTFSFNDIVNMQEGPLNFSIGQKDIVIGFLPNWGIFFQPLGAILFFVATFAETNRAPFDLPEAEAELVAGFHTEYGGLKMLLFFIGEYGHMMVASALMTTLFFGSYHIPFVTPDGLLSFLNSFMGAGFAKWIQFLIFHISFMLKVIFFLWVFVWVRWTVPRFRYDQLMDLGWKKMLPWALFNTVVTAVAMLLLA